ncbi:MAG: DUF488 domain-containing protein [Nitrospirae bacterium]|nr:DUF488 domain-containing protein [Nitrospirota bacterium]
MRSTSLVYSIGHSTRPIGEFLALLKAYQIEEVVDIRTVPRSRHNPQFNVDVLPGSLEREAIEYRHMKGLGGLRHALKDSPNMGWRNASFRGFADYMQTPEFEESLELLVKEAQRMLIALMCAEAVPWRCHRSLVADALTVRGVKVEHIMSETSHHLHTITPFAKVRGSRITYPPEH